MKTITIALILFLTSLGLWAQTPMPGNQQDVIRQIQARRAAAAAAAAANAPSAPSADPNVQPRYAPANNYAPAAPAEPDQPEEMIQPGTIDFEGVDVVQVLEVYSKLVHRTLLRAGLPQASIILKTETPLTKTETIQALQAVLALNGIAVVNVGDKFVKVVPVEQANTVGAPLDYSSAASLPELGSYVTHIVQLQWVKPSVMAPLIQPFAKLQGGITPLDDNGILILRDYAENVKRMLEMIEKIDVSVPAEYISEVIPIKYALAGDIANALNSLGGSGGSTVSFGGSSGAAPISGVAPNRTGLGGAGGIGGTGNTYQPGGVNTSGSSFGQRTSAFGTQATATTPNGTPTAGTSFQQRLNAIINRASGSGGQPDQIQVFGQAKIIADSRANSLLVFATRQDMVSIKKVINQLDVLLSQVLIEAAIIDYSLGPNTLSFGVSVAQNPQSYGGGLPVVGAGGINNGQTFLNFLQQVASGNTNSSSTTTTLSSNLLASSFANSLPGGLSYFGNIGSTWNVALSAAAADSHASIIQRPRIQTSQAKQAQFFVGDTVPYVTGNTYGSAYGNTASYSQLSVGVELDVTPFINPDGLVVMDINQEIDDLNGYTTIDNVGQIPNTIKRTLSSEIAVRDRDTVMLGGFIKSNKSTSRSGVPYLMNIPLLGNLFTQRNDSKAREELIVLMRPTVLKTPELAAEHTIVEEQQEPGVSQAAAEEAAEQRKLIDAQRKKELRRAKATTNYDGFFAQPPLKQPPQSQDDGSLNTVPPPANDNPPPPQVAAPAPAVPAAAPSAPASVAAKPATVVAPGQPPPAGQDNGFFYNNPPPK